MKGCNDTRAKTESSSSRNSQQDSTLPRTEVPSFDDPVVVRKMTKFHNNRLSSLQARRCTVCIERFPSIYVDTTSICKRCCNDKHVPKLYSADNNMDPGPVPPELTVSVDVMNTKILLTLCCCCCNVSHYILWLFCYKFRD